MTNQIDNTADIIDVESLTDRFDELESNMQDLQSAIDDAEDLDEQQHAEKALSDWKTSDEGQEFEQLGELLADIQGCGGDHQWNGDWYPQCLIADCHFEQYMDEMIDDCYSIPELPSFMTITLDYIALRQDYTSVEIDGVTYLMR